MSEAKSDPWLGFNNVEDLERALKELWAGVDFEQALEITATLNHFHRKMFGGDWDGISTKWLVECLVAQHRQTIRSLASLTFVEMVEMLRDDPTSRQLEIEGRWLTVGESAKTAGAEPYEITRAADRGDLKTNGENKHKRRIDAIDLTRWIRSRAEQSDVPESDESVERMLRRATEK
jgi:hypothetical protein